MPTPTPKSQPPFPIQLALQSAAAELRRIDQRLAALSDSLHPLPCAAPFHPHTELHDAITTVRADLLADAIDTLTLAATADEPTLRHRFRERQQWLAAAAR